MRPRGRGATSGDFHIHDAADATNAILGAALMAVLGRVGQKRDSASANFHDSVADQIIRGHSTP